VQRLNVAGTPRVVVKGFPEFLDAGYQSSVAHRRLGPDGAKQFVLGDHVAGTLGHEGQQREGFRREMDLARAGHQSDPRLKTITPERKCPILHEFLQRRG